MPDIYSFSKYLYENFDSFREMSFTHTHARHCDILPLVKKAASHTKIKVDKIGCSTEERDIFTIRIGKGKTKILAWTQMHGDEPTATRAIFGIINFLNSPGGSEFSKIIKDKLQITFIPMLNPDGAENVSRRNAAMIDINRDALKMECPESRILNDCRAKLRPDFCLNLHDQNSSYTAGYSHHSAAISFLAPPFNYEKDINHVRENSMKVIADSANAVQQFIPGHIGRYSDEFEPRAFGDNFVKEGSSVILIESGSWKDDPDKIFLEKITFISILSALFSIASQSYSNQSTESYFAIPENKELLYDLIIRNAAYRIGKYTFKVDVAVKQTEKLDPVSKELFLVSSIEDFGDLSTFYGHKEINCSGMELVPGKVFTGGNLKYSDLLNVNFEYLYENGYTYLQIDDLPIGLAYSRFPINLTAGRINREDTAIEIEKTADFLIVNDGNVVFAVVNGFVADLKNKIFDIRNGLIL